MIVILYCRALALIEGHGGNPHLSSLIKELRKIYTQPEQTSSADAQDNSTGQGQGPVATKGHLAVEEKDY